MIPPQLTKRKREVIALLRLSRGVGGQSEPVVCRGFQLAGRNCRSGGSVPFIPSTWITMILD
jgi:hypothetical protein